MNPDIRAKAFELARALRPPSEQWLGPIIEDAKRIEEYLMTGRDPHNTPSANPNVAPLPQNSPLKKADW